MAKSLYKYFSDTVIDYAFSRDDFVGIKCSLPKDYNDPFELFLGIDVDNSPEMLATYREIVEEIPQLLTSCFSRSPVVSPMWAHYGNNHRGFVVGFDVAALQSSFPDIFIRDISYREEPDSALNGFLQMAAYRRKPRDAMHLQNSVLYHGYFSKYAEWSYEQEIRAVDLSKYTEESHGNSILYVPKECISTVIAGKNCSDDHVRRLSQLASALGCEFLKGAIGRSYPTPYLLSDKDIPKTFQNGEICAPVGECQDCSEPLIGEGSVCPWCAIEDSHRMDAARGNPLRILSQHDLLEDYIKNFPRGTRRKYE